LQSLYLASDREFADNIAKNLVVPSTALYPILSIMHHANRLCRSLLTAIFCATLFFTSSLAYAPAAAALTMNPVGDYLQAKGSRGTMYPQWQVVDADPKGLNCRANPAFAVNMDVSQPDVSKWPVLKTFKPGAKLPGVGGNNGNVPISIEDNRGKPWIVISTTNNEKGNCLVRANSQFVRPLLPAGSDGWRCRCRAKDCGSREHPNSFTVEKTTQLDPSSPDYSCAPFVPQISSTFGLEEKMFYATARQKLIDQGWLPHDDTSPKLQNKTVKALFDKGFEEVRDCSGAGLGLCRFEWSNPTHDLLIVAAGAGANGDRIVTSWSINP
jgi:hypothetical protein